MPPKERKRKAPLTPADSNAVGTVSECGTKKAKMADSSKEVKSTGRKKTFKYSNADTVCVISMKTWELIYH